MLQEFTFQFVNFSHGNWWCVDRLIDIEDFFLATCGRLFLITSLKICILFSSDCFSLFQSMKVKTCVFQNTVAFPADHIDFAFFETGSVMCPPFRFFLRYYESAQKLIRITIQALQTLKWDIHANTFLIQCERTNAAPLEHKVSSYTTSSFGAIHSWTFLKEEDEEQHQT